MLSGGATKDGDVRLLLVEDDVDLAGQLKAALSENGFDVDHCADGDEALDFALVGDYEIILLDLMLPGLDGRSLLRHLRIESDTPVLILTARDGLEERVGGLDDGADDFLVKPFELPELLARLRALVRRAAGAGKDRIAAGNLVVDLRRKQALVAGQPVDLSPQEYRVLEVLALQNGKPLSALELGQRVAGSDEEDRSAVVTVQIHRLRSKLGSERIRTQRGFGYYLADVGETSRSS